MAHGPLPWADRILLRSCRLAAGAAISSPWTGADGQERGIMNGRRHLKWMLALGIAISGVTILAVYAPSSRAAIPTVDARDTKAARQRLEENVAQILRALADLGSAIPEDDRVRLDVGAGVPDDEAIGTIQEVLDQYALLMVHIDDEAWFKISPASPDPNSRRLVQSQWKTYLVKVNNEGRITSPLEVRSPQALPMEARSQSLEQSSVCDANQPHDWSQWLLLRLFKQPPMQTTLSGRELEYFILQLCSLDTGIRAAEIVFYLGGGQVSQGHYADTHMLFYIEKAPAP